MEDIRSLAQCKEALDGIFESDLDDDTLCVFMLGREQQPVCLSMANEDTKINIVFKIGSAEDLSRESLFMLLDANSRVNPYAFAIVTAADSDEFEDYEQDVPLILIDSVPVGDLCREELIRAIEDLKVALMQSSILIRDINTVAVPA